MSWRNEHLSGFSHPSFPSPQTHMLPCLSSAGGGLWVMTDRWQVAVTYARPADIRDLGTFWVASSWIGPYSLSRGFGVCQCLSAAICTRGRSQVDQRQLPMYLQYHACCRHTSMAQSGDIECRPTYTPPMRSILALSGNSSPRWSILKSTVS